MIGRGRRAKLLLAIVSLIVALLLAEGVMRLGGRPTFAPDPAAIACVPDSALGWIFPPDSSGVYHGGAVPTDVVTNPLGLRGPAVGPDHAGGARLVVLGDSYAFGWGVAENECFPRRLEGALRTRFPDRPLEVVNAAMPGHSVYQQARMLERLRARMRIDAVVATISLSNDAVDEMRVRRFAPDLGDYDACVRDPRSWTTKVIRASRLLSLLDEATLHWRFARANADDAAMDLCLDSLRGLATQCREGGMPLLWLVVPRVQEIRPGGRMSGRLVATAEKQRARIETLAIDLGVPLLDLRPALARAHADGDVFLPDDPHWTAAGHAAVTEDLLAMLPAILPGDPESR